MDPEEHRLEFARLGLVLIGKVWRPNIQKQTVLRAGRSITTRLDATRGEFERRGVAGPGVQTGIGEALWLRGIADAQKAKAVLVSVPRESQIPSRHASLPLRGCVAGIGDGESCRVGTESR